MRRTYHFWAPDEQGQTQRNDREYTNALEIAGFWGRWFGYNPTDAPGEPSGHTGVCAVHAWNDGLTAGNITAHFEYEFNAPCNMMLTGFQCETRDDISALFPTRHARLSIGIGAPPTGAVRWKYLSRSGLIPYKYLDLPLEGSWQTRGGENAFLYPLLAPKGTHVIIRLELHCELQLLSSVYAWVRVANAILYYRGGVNIQRTGNEARSLINGKMLPADSLRLQVRAIDDEYLDDIIGYPVLGRHGTVSQPGSIFGSIITASPTWFAPFRIRSDSGNEEFFFSSGGFQDSAAVDAFLGVGTSYIDAPEADDGYQTTIEIPAVIGSFIVAKRTPFVLFNDLPVLPLRIHLGDLTPFQGSIQDPEQAGLKDFVAGMNAQIQRLDAAWMNLENPIADGNGAFIAQHTMGLSDLGVNKRWRVTTPSTVQYNPSVSIVQTRTIWEIVQTMFSRFTFEKPEILKGEQAIFRFTLIEQSSTLGVAGNPSIMIQRLEGGVWTDLHSEPLAADGAGTWTWADPSSLLPLGLDSIIVPCRALFLGSTFGFKEYQEAQPAVTINLTINRIPSGLGNLVLGVKFDNKDFAELIGSKSVHFQLDKPDYYGVRDFYEPTGVLVNPDTYKVTCDLTVGERQFSDSESRTVGADQDVLLNFSFVSPGITEGTGKIVITLMSSAELIKLGETLTLTGSVARPTRLRTFILPFVKIRIKSGDTLLATTRTGVEGTFAVNLKLDQLGTVPIYAELSGPLGQYPIATSGELGITVIS